MDLIIYFVIIYIALITIALIIIAMQTILMRLNKGHYLILHQLNQNFSMKATIINTHFFCNIT